MREPDKSQLSIIKTMINKDQIKYFPQTRFQGSKVKLTSWLTEILTSLDFENCLDAFGGSASVSYLMKTLGKKVTYNDIMNFNYIIGSAFLENDHETLSDEDLGKILSPSLLENYDTIIERNFRDIYYLDDENRWLDVITQNIHSLENKNKKNLAFWALFQSCLIKRPYNLFHRKNLHMRTSEVKRSFGNKATWDRPFEEHFRKFVKQINSSVFSNGQKNISINRDATAIQNTFDLVYFDTPYIPEKGSITDYAGFYHFLEGLAQYRNWETKIDFQKKHHPLKYTKTNWTNKYEITNEFETLIRNFKDSIIVISYRKDGIPSINQISALLSKYKSDIKVHTYEYKYALSKKKVNEVIIVAK
jgi:adenine-specific DNA-methyltransferase